MKYNLLKMTQLILSAMDSDEINSITDTVEAQQVVDVIETTYNDLLSVIDLPRHEDLFELEGLGDVSYPTRMDLPSDVQELYWVYYNTTKLKLIEIEDMLKRSDALDPSTDTTAYEYTYTTSRSETYTIRGRNDRDPTAYAIGEDGELIMDHYDSDVDSTLVGNKTRAYGLIIPDFSRSDSWTPPLDARTFSLFFNEAKAQAFIELKQVQNAKADQRARRAWAHAGRNRARISGEAFRDAHAPNYGRPGRR